MRKMLFVFNPNSGKAQIKNSLLQILQIFSDAGFEVTVYPTKASLDGYAHVLESEGKYDIIVCSGGDGTLNETVGAVLKYADNKVPIGYIPSGTTNDFAASLGIPKNMIKAAVHIVDGSPVKCDIGMVNNNRSFNYVAAFGAFTEVSYATPQPLKNVLGHQAYILEGVKSIPTMQTYFMKVTSGDTVIEDVFHYGMVSNARSVGGFKGIVGKDVSLNDGLFEVMLIKKINNPIEFQQVVMALVSQSYDKCDLIYTFKTKSVTFESDQKVSWTLDGEYGGDFNKICVDVLHNAVEFMIAKRKRTVK